MKRKILATGMALVLTFSMTVGCAKTTESNTQTTEVSEDAQTEESAAESETEASEPVDENAEEAVTAETADDMTEDEKETVAADEDDKEDEENTTIEAIKKDLEEKAAAEGESKTKGMKVSNSYQKIGDVDTSEESYQQPVTIVNNSGKRIERMCIAASEDTCWGDDICGQYYMDDGDALETSFCVHDNYTTYDFYWVYEDDTKETCSGFDLSDYPTDGFTITIKEGSVSTSFDTNF